MKNKKSVEKAVALSYDGETDRAPRIVAKGEGFIAERIVRVAREYDVPFYRDADLCEVLVKMDVDAEVPSDLYEPVAKILAFVYMANQKAARR